MTSRGATMTSPTLIFSALSMLIERKTSMACMNSSPRAYLKVAFLTPLRRSALWAIWMTSSCSTWPTSTSPMPSGSQNFSSSANGSMVWTSPFSYTMAGLLHSSIVVQTLKPKLMPLAPGISRLLPSRMPISSISSKRWSAA